MKILKPFSLLIAFSLPCVTVTCAQNSPSAPAQSSSQAPDETIKKLSDLVHAGHYDEARQSVAGLLILYPDDQRIVKAKALLDKSPAAASAPSAQPANAPANGNNTASQPVASDPTAQLKGMDRVSYDALLELAHQAQQTPDLTQQKSLLQQFMNQSGPFVQQHPEQTLLWQLRAASALSLNDPDEGYNAAQKLLAAGAADTNDPNLLRLMAQLKNKDWLDQVGVTAAKAKIENDKKYGWIVGTWETHHTWFQTAAFDYGKRQNTLKVEFVRSGDMVLGYVIRQDNGGHAAVPFLQYTVPPSGKPDLSCWSFNDESPIKWQRPVESFNMGNDANTFQLNMKYRQWTYSFTKISDSVSESTSADAQLQLAQASQPAGKKSKRK